MERPVGRLPLIVYYRGYLYLAAAVWPICWWMLYGVFIRSEEPFIRHGQGALIGRLFTVFVVAVNGAAGPVLTAYFSLRLEITDAEIDVRKYFGLWRRRYPLPDWVATKYLPRNRQKDWISVRLRFRDGGRATVERHAVGYQAVVDRARARGHFERGPYG